MIANGMLYHVPDIKKGLSEVRRVLKKGGTFYCSTFGEQDLYKCRVVYDEWKSIIKKTKVVVYENSELDNGGKLIVIDNM